MQYGKTFKRGWISRIDLQADAYYNEVTDKIVAVPKGKRAVPLDDDEPEVTWKYGALTPGPPQNSACLGTSC
ncbi:MAG: hypothetical protein ACLT37_14720 [Bacteroides stercoris]